MQLNLTPAQRQEAARLAALPYSIVIEPWMTNGKIHYSATHPELLGCRGSGPTPEAAIADLAEARQLYIEGLIEFGAPVPEPQLQLADAA